VSTGAFAGAVLWPARISFAVNADRLYDVLSSYREDTEVYLLKAARGLRIVYLRNETVIEQRELIFRLALVALGAETLLWTLALALP
jgi:hypothetical protein